MMERRELKFLKSQFLFWLHHIFIKIGNFSISLTSIESTTSDWTSKPSKLMKNATSKELWDIKIYLNFLVLTRCFGNTFVCIYEQTSQMYQKIANTSKLPKSWKHMLLASIVLLLEIPPSVSVSCYLHIAWKSSNWSKSRRYPSFQPLFHWCPSY